MTQVLVRQGSVNTSVDSARASAVLPAPCVRALRPMVEKPTPWRSAVTASGVAPVARLQWLPAHASGTTCHGGGYSSLLGELSPVQLPCASAACGAGAVPRIACRRSAERVKEGMRTQPHTHTHTHTTHTHTMRPRIDAVAGATGQRLHYRGQRPRKRGSACSLRARPLTAGEKAHAVAFSGDGKRPRDRPNKVLSLLSVHLTIKEFMRFRRQETTCSDTSAFMTYNPHKSTPPTLPPMAAELPHLLDRQRFDGCVILEQGRGVVDDGRRARVRGGTRLRRDKVERMHLRASLHPRHSPCPRRQSTRRRR